MASTDSTVLECREKGLGRREEVTIETVSKRPKSQLEEKRAPLSREGSMEARLPCFPDSALPHRSPAPSPRRHSSEPHIQTQDHSPDVFFIVSANHPSTSSPSQQGSGHDLLTSTNHPIMSSLSQPVLQRGRPGGETGERRSESEPLSQSLWGVATSTSTIKSTRTSKSTPKRRGVDLSASELEDLQLAKTVSPSPLSSGASERYFSDDEAQHSFRNSEPSLTEPLPKRKSPRRSRSVQGSDPCLTQKPAQLFVTPQRRQNRKSNSLSALSSYYSSSVESKTPSLSEKYTKLARRSVKKPASPVEFKLIMIPPVASSPLKHSFAHYAQSLAELYRADMVSSPSMKTEDDSSSPTSSIHTGKGFLRPLDLQPRAPPLTATPRVPPLKRGLHRRVSSDRRRLPSTATSSVGDPLVVGDKWLSPPDPVFESGEEE